jgi:hypothetical protein
MTSKDISQAKDPALRGSLEALRRASELARRTAIETDTDLIIVKDGHTVRVPAAVLCEQASQITPPTS